MAVLVAGITFLMVLMIFLVASLAARGKSGPESVRKRLEAIEKAQKRGHVSLELDLLRDELLSDVPLLHRLLQQWSWSGRMRDFLAQAGMKIKPGKLIIISAVLSAGAYFVVYYVYHKAMLAVPAAGLAAILPLVYVAFMRRRRLRQFEKNFPEAIDLLGRAVRAGHAFTTGLEMIGQELPEPVAGEFRTTFEQQNFGLPLKEALLNMTDRIPLIDLRFFVIALLIQKDTGGNLAEILDNLSRVIRERFRIYGEVRIRTAQGRMTAGILIALPPMMGIVLMGMNPTYIRPLIDDIWGNYMLIGAGLLQIIGSAILWKIVNIEV